MKFDKHDETMNISKELLSEVLEYKVFASISNDTNELKCLFVDLDKSKELRINIYELAHKCKEWAYEKGFILLSCNETCQIIPNDCQAHSDLIEHSIDCDEELNGVFNACEWIYKKFKGLI